MVFYWDFLVAPSSKNKPDYEAEIELARIEIVEFGKRLFWEILLKQKSEFEILYDHGNGD